MTKNFNLHIMKIKDEFYALRATQMAPKSIGKLLCRKINNEIIRLRITETEIYFGEDDSACHASKGKTNRTKIMYESGGLAYIYLCYGIHSMLNIVSGVNGFPEACLIRGVEGFNGPGKLTKALNITTKLNGANLKTSDEIWLEDDGKNFKYFTDKRIGINYAEKKDRDKKWRFILKL